jgi:hypothetical protein
MIIEKAFCCAVNEREKKRTEMKGSERKRRMGMEINKNENHIQTGTAHSTG